MPDERDGAGSPAGEFQERGCVCERACVSVLIVSNVVVACAGLKQSCVCVIGARHAGIPPPTDRLPPALVNQPVCSPCQNRQICNMLLTEKHYAGRGRPRSALLGLAEVARAIT